MTRPVFPILRQLIKAWFQNSFSDDPASSAHSLKLTANFYQWILPTESSISSQLITKRSCLFTSLQLILRRALGILSGLTVSLTGKAPLLPKLKITFNNANKLLLENSGSLFEYFVSNNRKR